MSAVEAKEPKFSDAIEVTDTPTKDPSANETITLGATSEKHTADVQDTGKEIVGASRFFFPELEWQ